MTDAQGLRLLALNHQLWSVAKPAGSMHAWWDVISDIDAFVKRKPTLVQKTADEWIAEAELLLKSSQ